ncbi:hypothetical protein ACOME3_006307 [Neoechinorhynchus agilis]
MSNSKRPREGGEQRDESSAPILKRPKFDRRLQRWYYTFSVTSKPVQLEMMRCILRNHCTNEQLKELRETIDSLLKCDFFSHLPLDVCLRILDSLSNEDLLRLSGASYSHRRLVMVEGGGLWLERYLNQKFEFYAPWSACSRSLELYDNQLRSAVMGEKMSYGLMVRLMAERILRTSWKFGTDTQL